MKENIVNRGVDTFYSIPHFCKELEISNYVFHTNPKFKSIAFEKIGNRKFIPRIWLQELLNRSHVEKWFCLEVTMLLEYVIRKIGRKEVEKRLKYKHHISTYFTSGTLSSKKAAKVLVIFRGYVKEFENWMYGPLYKEKENEI